jgi:HPt (histidine-containing phosphotransfer) domain-containing protein
MQDLAAQMMPSAPAPPIAGYQLLDRQHLRHQTLADSALERIVLQLFLEESPRYASDVSAACDAGAWRMAVHTLKGVALNIGAFRLAQVCRKHEGAWLRSDPGSAFDAAGEIVSMTETTVQAIREIVPQDCQR